MSSNGSSRFSRRSFSAPWSSARIAWVAPAHADLEIFLSIPPESIALTEAPRAAKDHNEFAALVSELRLEGSTIRVICVIENALEIVVRLPLSSLETRELNVGRSI